MGNPAVTVLMTVYNGAEYLSLAIRSVLSQDFTDFEFLIVDDCSKDASREMVRGVVDSRISLLCNPENIGQTASLNAGLAAARGTYIARIDADDVALPGWLSAQMACARANTDAAVISLPVVLIDATGRVRKLQGTCSVMQDMYLRLLTHSPINHGGCLMRREVVLREGGYDSQHKIAADFALWSRLARSGYRICASSHVGMAVRVHGGSVSQTGMAVRREELKAICQENLATWTDYRLGYKDWELLWGLFYDLDNFPRADIASAEAVFEKMILSRKPELQITDAVCQQYIRAVVRENFLRSCFRIADRLPVVQWLPFMARGILWMKAVRAVHRKVIV